MVHKREFKEDMKAVFYNFADNGIEDSNKFCTTFNDWAEKYREYSPFSTGALAPISWAEKYGEYSTFSTGAHNQTIGKYFGGLIVALCVAKDGIDKIFKAANKVENAYAEGFEEIAFEMGQYANKITALRSLLLPPQGDEVEGVTSSPLNTMDSEDFAALLDKCIMDTAEQEAQALIDRYVVDGDWESYVQELLQKDQQDLTSTECQALKMIYDKLGMVNGDKAKFFEMASGCEGLMALMKEKDIKDLADYYVDSGRWEEYVQDQMLKDPEGISYTEYLVMIGIFENLPPTGKEKFIELAYSLEKKPMDINDLGMYRDPYCNFTLSPVFDKMSDIYNQITNNLDLTYDELANENSIIHEKIFWNQLLLGISIYGKEILYYTPDYNGDGTTYDGTHGIKVTIRHLYDNSIEDDNRIVVKPWDYTVIINGYTSVEGVIVEGDEEDAELLSLELFQFSVNLTSILHKEETMIIESMIPDAKQETGIIVIESGIGVIPGFSVLMVALDILRAYNDATELREKGDEIEKDKTFEEVCRALQLGGTAIICCSSGRATIGTTCINENELRDKISDYNENLSDKELDELINMINSGDVTSTDFDFNGYILHYNRNVL